MSATVVAIIKAVITVLTDKKLFKTVCGIILGVIIIIFIPILTLLALFDGAADIDWSQISQIVVEQLDPELREELQHVQTTMSNIESAMLSAGFSGTAMRPPATGSVAVPFFWMRSR